MQVCFRELARDWKTKKVFEHFGAVFMLILSIFALLFSLLFSSPR